MPAAALKVLHAADLHLGGPVAVLDRAVSGLAGQARGLALNRLVDLAVKHQVAALLLAGDVFDSPRPPLSAMLALESACAKLARANIRVFIAPGNHDPWQPDSVWEWLELPPLTTVFGPRAGGVELGEWGLWVAGAGHDSQHVEQDLSTLLPPPPEGLTGLAVLHCAVSSSDGAAGHEPYAPAVLEGLIRSPFAYWALGHIHKQQILNQQPLVLYAGTSQGAHLGETGPKGAWLVEISSGLAKPEFVPLAGLEFLDMSLDGLMEVKSPGGLAALARQSLDPGRSGQRAGRCARLRLFGPSPLWDLWSSQDWDDLAVSLAQELGLAALRLDGDGLRPPLDLEQLAGRSDLLGRFLGLAQRVQDDPDFLRELAAGLTGKLHPNTSQKDQAVVGERLADLARAVGNLGLAGLWQGEGGHEA